MSHQSQREPRHSKKRVFLSYRREDTRAEASHLFDSLKQYFDEDRLFRDIAGLEPGVNFAEAIHKHLDGSSVMLALIGSNWEGKTSDGSLRIKNPDDWIRLEITNAFRHGMLVVPILFDGAKLPNVNDLPDDLKPFLLLHAYEINDSRWE